MEKSKRPFYKKWWFILIMIAIVIGVVSKMGSDGEKFSWSDIELGEKLPRPKSNIGEILSNSDKRLSMYVHKTSSKEYKAYLKACEEKGYVIESDKSESRYDAYNADGYKLGLWYIEDEKELSISLDAPEEMAEISWTTNGVGSMLPKPKSNVGKVTQDSSDVYTVKVGSTTLSDYAEYVKACEEEGFIVDYSKYDESYSAHNEEGYELSVRYIGFNIMEVSIKVPAETEQAEIVEDNNDKIDVDNQEENKMDDDTDTSEVNETKDDSTVLVNGMRPEFKEAMDSYEAFYVEYCDVLEKYRNNSTDLSILTEYAELAEQSAEMSEKFDAWDSEEMNNTELMYYLEVLGRVTKMLQSVGE